MKRPEQHETDDKGDALFRSIFSEWGVNPSEKDYGWDYAVEVFRNRETTGLIFNAQLKSSASTKYSKDGTFISQTLETEAAEYLAEQLKQPTFLFHADVQTGKLFWSAIQLDEAVLKSLDQRKTASITVRVPTTNLLPAGLDRFLDDLTKAHFVVVRRALEIANPTDFVNAMRGHAVPKNDEFAEDLHYKAHALSLQTAFDIFHAGDIPDAKGRIRRVLESSDASINTRFEAELQLGDVEWYELMKSGKPQVLSAERIAETGRRLWSMTRREAPAYLKLFALLTKKAGELALLIYRHAGLSMNWKAQTKLGTDPVWVAVLAAELNSNLAAIGRKYKQCLRLANTAAASPHRWSASAAITKIAKEVPTLVGILESSDLPELAEQYRQSGFQLFRMAAELAIDNNDIPALWSAATLGLLLESSTEGEVFKWSRGMVAVIPEGNDYRARADQFTENVIRRWQGETLPGDIATTRRQVHENILSSFGIDPLAEPWAGMIAVAIKDSDLGRVLKDCEHLFVSAGPRPPMLDQLGLQHAGPKTLHCTLHKYAVNGPDLDGIYTVFKKRYCDPCKDKSPRPDAWKFNFEWQDKENQRRADYLREFDRRAGRFI